MLAAVRQREKTGNTDTHTQTLWLCKLFKKYLYVSCECGCTCASFMCEYTHTHTHVWEPEINLLCHCLGTIQPVFCLFYPINTNSVRLAGGGAQAPAMRPRAEIINKPSHRIFYVGSGTRTCPADISPTEPSHMHPVFPGTLYTFWSALACTQNSDTYRLSLCLPVSDNKVASPFMWPSAACFILGVIFPKGHLSFPDGPRVLLLHLHEAV